jgi:RNA polymerase sigma-70 factor (ECF subfamily)
MEQTCDRAEAVRRLVGGYSGSLYRLAFAYLKNRHDAEDAVQEVFLAYLDKAPRFLSEAHEKAWLIRVTVNRCKNQLKSGWFKSR